MYGVQIIKRKEKKRRKLNYTLKKIPQKKV